MKRDWKLMKSLPAHQRLMLLLGWAGRLGMHRGEIGSMVDLPADTLDGLLDALVRSGELSLTNERGYRIYRRLL
jgi:DNA-binding IclR family transcriptional regulator